MRYIYVLILFLNSTFFQKQPSVHATSTFFGMMHEIMSIWSSNIYTTCFVTTVWLLSTLSITKVSVHYCTLRRQEFVWPVRHAFIRQPAALVLSSCIFWFSSFMWLRFESEHLLQRPQYGWDVRLQEQAKSRFIVIRHIACFRPVFGMIDAKCSCLMSTLF